MKKIYVSAFFLALALLSFMTFFLPRREYSQVENRPLAGLPTVAVGAFQSRDAQNSLEQYLSDHLPMREDCLTLYTQLELMAGKRERNGVYIGETRLLENVSPPAAEITKQNCDAINAFAQNYYGVINSSVALIPTALEFYGEEAPPFSSHVDQKAYIQNFYKALPYTRNLDLSASLSAAAEQSIFYRTDERWTSYGAFVGYTALSKPLGYRALSLDSFTIEHVSHDFLGTLYTRALYGEQMADSVDLYQPVGDNPVTDVIQYSGENSINHDSVFFRENVRKKDQYSVFLGENSAVTQIFTNVKNGRRLLIFTDGYAKALAQFLPFHYEEVAIIDTSMFSEDLFQYLNPMDYQQVLFLYSVGSFTDTTDLVKVMEY